MKKKESLYIIISVIILSTVMNLVDMVLIPPYFTKSAIKVCLFLLAPLGYLLLNKQELPRLKALYRIQKKDLLLAGGLGLTLYAGIVGGYFLLQNFLGLSSITEKLTQTVGVTADNFLYVSAYICICNSFLEEFFFRGFAFMLLKQHTGRRFAYGFSSALFAFYHIGMTFGWVEPLIFALGFIGLVIGGLIFDYLNEKTGSIYPSWLAHGCVNLGINTVGFILFGII